MKIELNEILEIVKTFRKNQTDLASYSWDKMLDHMESHNLTRANDMFNAWGKFEAKVVVLDDLLHEIEKKYLSSESMSSIFIDYLIQKQVEHEQEHEIKDNHVPCSQKKYHCFAFMYNGKCKCLNNTKFNYPCPFYKEEQ